MKWLAILAFLSGGLLWSLTQTQPAKSDVLQLETYHEPCGGVSEDYEYILIRWVDSSGNTVRTLYPRRRRHAVLVDLRVPVHVQRLLRLRRRLTARRRRPRAPG